MRIVVDRNNPCAEDAFRQFGDVHALPTQEITNASVRDAEILIVRSETNVTKNLLDGTAVQFVGSATIGTDHVDIDYVRSSGRTFVNAPGSNANAVAEYVVAALLNISQKRSISLQGTSLGVVGVGNIGSKVIRYAAALGLTVLQNDPPLARTTGHAHFLPLDALMECDILTLHVPLTTSGVDATHHLFSHERISRMKEGAIVINTSRGSVVDGDALKQALAARHLSGALLDVWENEPLIDGALLRAVDIGTPHIAGYSYDGKVAAVKMVYDEACRHYNQPVRWSPEQDASQSSRDTIVADGSVKEKEKIMNNIIRQCYNIDDDDKALRSISSVPEKDRGLFFRRLRAQYPVRREFFNFNVSGAHSIVKKTLSEIGFHIL